MTRMLSPDRHCVDAETPRGRYRQDAQGIMHVTNSRDVQSLKDAGFLIAGATPVTARYWLCGCGWRALFNSCPRCGRRDLTRVTGDE